jgi:hypothetical protein
VRVFVTLHITRLLIIAIFPAFSGIHNDFFFLSLSASLHLGCNLLVLPHIFPLYIFLEGDMGQW